jgi:hypothetical protein
MNLMRMALEKSQTQLELIKSELDFIKMALTLSYYTKSEAGLRFKRGESHEKY